MLFTKLVLLIVISNEMHSFTVNVSARLETLVPDTAKKMFENFYAVYYITEPYIAMLC